MTLREFLNRQGLTYQPVARAAGVSESYMSRIVRGAAPISSEQIIAIEDFSGGTVTAADLISVRRSWLAQHPDKTRARRGRGRNQAGRGASSTVPALAGDGE